MQPEQNQTQRAATPTSEATADSLVRTHLDGNIFRLSAIEESIPWEHIQSHQTIFNPRDPWAAITRAGLLSMNSWKDQRVAEVGIGSGVTSGVLLQQHPDIAVLFGTDLNEHAVGISEKNIALLAPHSADRFCGISGANDLLNGLLNSEHLNPEVSSTRLDRVYACIPQMLVPEIGYTPPPDALAHYLRPQDSTGIPYIDRHGLALNARLLEQARLALKESGSMVLTISGRPPAAVVTDMFRQFGFSEPVVRYSKLMEQDPGTSIDQLARIERRFVHEGVRFEFWGENDIYRGGETPEVRSRARPITACEAKAVLACGGKIFHYVHVLESFLEGAQ